MRVTILKSFPYGADGIHAVTLRAGSEADIHDELVPGLEREGWVKRVGFDPVAIADAFEEAVAKPMRARRKRP